MQPECAPGAAVHAGERPASSASGPPAVLLIATLALGFAAPPAIADGQNLALHRPYALDPAPNYALTSDPGDATQLTDGARAGAATLWLSREAVGWQGARPVTITIDLGELRAVSGVGFSTAAGRAGVDWPAAILIATSSDGVHYADVGELVGLDQSVHGGPPAAGYATYVYRTNALRTSARYVRLVVDPRGQYLFADEIEVYALGRSAAQTPPEPIADTTAYFWSEWLPARALAGGLQAQLEMLRTRIAQARIDGARKAGYRASTDALAAALATLSVADFERAQPTAPFNALQARLLAIAGEVDAAEGAPRLTLWSANPWDALSMFERASAAHADDAVLLMQGERRAAAMNLRNGTGEDLDVELAATLDGAPSQQLSLGRVLWTAARDGRAIASAIEPLGAAPLHVPAGLTLQVWLTIASEGLSAGSHALGLELRERGALRASNAIAVEVLPLRFPAHHALALAGWDYSDSPGPYGLTAANLGDFIALMHLSDAVLPWASSAVLAGGRFDAAGAWATKPATAALEGWIQRWPGAPRYRVFLGAPGALGGIAVGSPAFAVAARNWAGFWAEAFRRQGIAPERVDLLLVDEPEGPVRAERTLALARPLRAAGAGFHIWMNPIYPAADAIPVELAAVADSVCVDRTALTRSASGYDRWLAAQRHAGKSVEIYATRGPAHLMDPYAYYRLQAWRAFAHGAVVSSYWSFADSGGASSFREYASPRVPFTPLFIDSGRVLDSRHLEAIFAGQNDYEYLHMLAELLVAPGAAFSPGYARASAALQSSLDAVLAGDDGGTTPWAEARRDGARADRARRDLAHAIMALGGEAR
jgi:hypothetical protein